MAEKEDKYEVHPRVKSSEFKNAELAGIVEAGSYLFVTDKKTGTLLCNRDGKFVEWKTKEKIVFDEPRGLSYFDHHLYVIDKNFIHKLDLKSKKGVSKFEIPKFEKSFGDRLQVDEQHIYFTIAPVSSVFICNHEGTEIVEMEETHSLPRGLSLDAKEFYICGFPKRSEVGCYQKADRKLIRELECKHTPSAVVVWDKFLFVATSHGLTRLKKKKSSKPEELKAIDGGVTDLTVHNNCLYFLANQRIAILSEEQAFGSTLENLKFEYCEMHPVRHLLTYLGPLNDILDACGDSIPFVGELVKPFTKLFERAITFLEKQEEKVEKLNELIQETANWIAALQILEEDYTFPEVLTKPLLKLKKYVESADVNHINQVELVIDEVRKRQIRIKSFVEFLPVLKARPTKEGVSDLYDYARRDLKEMENVNVDKIRKLLKDFHQVVEYADKKEQREIKLKSVFFASILAFIAIAKKLPQDTMRSPENYYPNFYYKLWKEDIETEDKSMADWAKLSGWLRVSADIRKEYIKGLHSYEVYIESAQKVFKIEKDFKPRKISEY